MKLDICWIHVLPRFLQIKGVVAEAHRSLIVDRDGQTVVDLIETFLGEAMEEDDGSEDSCRAYIEHAVQTVSTQSSTSQIV